MDEKRAQTQNAKVVQSPYSANSFLMRDLKPSGTMKEKEAQGRKATTSKTPSSHTLPVISDSGPSLTPFHSFGTKAFPEEVVEEGNSGTEYGNDIDIDSEGYSEEPDAGTLKGRKSTVMTGTHVPTRRSTRAGRGTGGAIARAEKISEQIVHIPKKRSIVDENIFDQIAGLDLVILAFSINLSVPFISFSICYRIGKRERTLSKMRRQTRNFALKKT
jgi:hypothetical protein